MSTFLPHISLRSAALAGLAALALAGCDSLRRDRGDPAFDGVYFAANLSADETNPHNFTIAVKDARKSLVGAREAGRYEANKYCIKYYGNSEKTWTRGPDATDPQLVFSDKGDLLMSGSCVGW